MPINYCNTAPALQPVARVSVVKDMCNKVETVREPEQGAPQARQHAVGSRVSKRKGSKGTSMGKKGSRCSPAAEGQHLHQCSAARSPPLDRQTDTQVPTGTSCGVAPMTGVCSSSGQSTGKQPAVRKQNSSKKAVRPKECVAAVAAAQQRLAQLLRQATKQLPAVLSPAVASPPLALDTRLPDASNQVEGLPEHAEQPRRGEHDARSPSPVIAQPEHEPQQSVEQLLLAAAQRVHGPRVHDFAPCSPGPTRQATPAQVTCPADSAGPPRTEAAQQPGTPFLPPRKRPATGPPGTLQGLGTPPKRQRKLLGQLLGLKPAPEGQQQQEDVKQPAVQAIAHRPELPQRGSSCNNEDCSEEQAAGPRHRDRCPQPQPAANTWSTAINRKAVQSGPICLQGAVNRAHQVVDCCKVMRGGACAPAVHREAGSAAAPASGAPSRLGARPAQPAASAATELLLPLWGQRALPDGPGEVPLQDHLQATADSALQLGSATQTGSVQHLDSTLHSPVATNAKVQQSSARIEDLFDMDVLFNDTSLDPLVNGIDLVQDHASPSSNHALDLFEDGWALDVAWSPAPGADMLNVDQLLEDIALGAEDGVMQGAAADDNGTAGSNDHQSLQHAGSNEVWQGVPGNQALQSGGSSEVVQNGDATTCCTVDEELPRPTLPDMSATPLADVLTPGAAQQGAVPHNTPAAVPQHATTVHVPQDANPAAARQHVTPAHVHGNASSPAACQHAHPSCSSPALAAPVIVHIGTDTLADQFATPEAALQLQSSPADITAPCLPAPALFAYQVALPNSPATGSTGVSSWPVQLGGAQGPRGGLLLEDGAHAQREGKGLRPESSLDTVGSSEFSSTQGVLAQATHAQQQAVVVAQACMEGESMLSMLVTAGNGGTTLGGGGTIEHHSAAGHSSSSITAHVVEDREPPAAVVDAKEAVHPHNASSGAPVQTLASLLQRAKATLAQQKRAQQRATQGRCAGPCTPSCFAQRRGNAAKRPGLVSEDRIQGLLQELSTPPGEGLLPDPFAPAAPCPKPPQPPQPVYDQLHDNMGLQTSINQLDVYQQSTMHGCCHMMDAQQAAYHQAHASLNSTSPQLDLYHQQIVPEYCHVMEAQRGAYPQPSAAADGQMSDAQQEAAFMALLEEEVDWWMGTTTVTEDSSAVLAAAAPVPALYNPMQLTHVPCALPTTVQLQSGMELQLT